MQRLFSATLISTAITLLLITPASVNAQAQYLPTFDPAVPGFEQAQKIKTECLETNSAYRTCARTKSCDYTTGSTALCYQQCGIQAGCGTCNRDADCTAFAAKTGTGLSARCDVAGRRCVLSAPAKTKTTADKQSTTPPMMKEGDAPQNDFAKKAVQTVAKKCPKQFNAFRDDILVDFMQCTRKVIAPCKLQEKQSPTICNTRSLERCRADVDAFLAERCGVAAAVTCDPSGHLERSSDGKSCACIQLYGRKGKKDPCLFAGARGLGLKTDSIDALEALIEKLGPTEGGTVELKLKNGKTILLGIIRLPNGKYLFTPDGKHYEDSPQDALSPGFLKSAGTSLGDLSKGFKGFFGIGKYVGPKDDAADGQLLTDAATAAFERLQGDTDPIKSLEKARETLERYQTLGKNLLGQEYEEQLLEELKIASGIDIGLIKKILTGDLTGIGADVVKQLYTFPAESVIILAKELRGANFTNAARLYARERAGGKTPTQIMALLRNGQLPELDFVTSIKGVGQSFGRGQLVLAYEEAYQRLLLAKKFKPLRRK